MKGGENETGKGRGGWDTIGGAVRRLVRGRRVLDYVGGNTRGEEGRRREGLNENRGICRKGFTFNSKEGGDSSDVRGGLRDTRECRTLRGDWRKVCSYKKKRI